MQRVAQACSSREFSPPSGIVDLALYDGFLSDADRPLLARVCDASKQELVQTRFDFHDQRLPGLLFRYRARNWPETLSAEEVQRWQQFCRHRLQDADGGGSITLAEYHERIALLRGEREGDADAQRNIGCYGIVGQGFVCDSVNDVICICITSIEIHLKVRFLLSIES